MGGGRVGVLECWGAGVKVFWCSRVLVFWSQLKEYLNTRTPEHKSNANTPIRQHVLNKKARNRAYSSIRAHPISVTSVYFSTQRAIPPSDLRFVLMGDPSKCQR